MARKNKLSIKYYLNTNLKGIEKKEKKHILYPLYIRITCDRQQAQFKSNFHGFIPLSSPVNKKDLYYLPFHEAVSVNDHRSFISGEEWSRPNGYQANGIKIEYGVIEKLVYYHLDRGKNIIGPGFSGLVSWSCWSVVEVVVHYFIKMIRREMRLSLNYNQVEVVLSLEAPDENLFSGLRQIFSGRNDDLANFAIERSDDIIALGEFIYTGLKIKLGRSFKSGIHEELILTPRVFDWATDENVLNDLMSYLVQTMNYEKHRAESFISSIQESIRAHFNTHFKSEIEKGLLILPF